MPFSTTFMRPRAAKEPLALHPVMFPRRALFIVAILLPAVAALPHLHSNTTPPTNGTICNSTFRGCDTNTNFTTNTPPLYQCVAVYPTDLAVLNSRYPDYDVDHLHQAKDYFMLRRQWSGDGEIATQVQFQGLPSNTSNQTCRLEFLLPEPRLQRLQGLNPTFDIYQVAQGADSIATWNTYVGYKENAEIFGIVNGEPRAVNRTRSVGGVAAINTTACSETLTFQMGMKYDSLELPNYWAFLNIEPPGWPIQGFRIVYGC